MRAVLDASISVKWVLPEVDSAKAILLRDEFRQGSHDFISPDVYPIEIAHALARAERRKLILVGEGWRKTVDVLSSPPDLHAYLPLLPRAFAIASQYRIGVYDCLYVALAEREACELITADDRLVKTLQPHFPFMVALAAVP